MVLPWISSVSSVPLRAVRIHHFFCNLLVSSPNTDLNANNNICPQMLSESHPSYFVLENLCCLLLCLLCWLVVVYVSFPHSDLFTESHRHLKVIPYCFISCFPSCSSKESLPEAQIFQETSGSYFWNCSFLCLLLQIHIPFMIVIPHLRQPILKLSSSKTSSPPISSIEVAPSGAHLLKNRCYYTGDCIQGLQLDILLQQDSSGIFKTSN